MKLLRGIFVHTPVLGNVEILRDYLLREPYSYSALTALAC